MYQEGLLLTLFPALVKQFIEPLQSWILYFMGRFALRCPFYGIRFCVAAGSPLGGREPLRLVATGGRCGLLFYPVRRRGRFAFPGKRRDRRLRWCNRRNHRLRDG